MMRLIVKDGSIFGFVASSAELPDTIPAPEGFDPADIDSYSLVDGVPALDQAAALNRAKTLKLHGIRAHFDEVMDNIRQSVANYEVETWSTQRDELVRYLTDPALPTPYVDTLALARGETRDTLFPKIHAKVQQLAAIQGMQQDLEKQVEAAESFPALETITW